MDLHESPVTSCLYFADCPHDLIPAFYSVGCRQKKTGYSEKVSQPHLYILNTVRCPYVRTFVRTYVRLSVTLGVASSVANDVIIRIAGLVAGCDMALAT